MTVRIEFSTATPAFDDSIAPGSFWHETTQVLEQVRKGLDSGLDSGVLFDSTDIEVGHWEYQEEPQA